MTTSQGRAQKTISPLASCNWRDFPKGEQLVYVNDEWVDAIEFVTRELEAVRQEAARETWEKAIAFVDNKNRHFEERYWDIAKEMRALPAPPEGRKGIKI